MTQGPSCHYWTIAPTLEFPTSTVLIINELRFIFCLVGFRVQVTVSHSVTQSRKHPDVLSDSYLNLSTLCINFCAHDGANNLLFSLGLLFFLMKHTFNRLFFFFFKATYCITCHPTQNDYPEPVHHISSLRGQTSSVATQTEVVLGFPAVAQFWPGPKSCSSKGHCPGLQTVREALTCIVFLGGLGSALSTARAPQPQG